MPLHEILAIILKKTSVQHNEGSPKNHTIQTHLPLQCC